MAQQMVSAAEEKENSLAEKQYLLAETLEQQKRCEVLTQQETELVHGKLMVCACIVNSSSCLACPMSQL